MVLVEDIILRVGGSGSGGSSAKTGRIAPIPKAAVNQIQVAARKLTNRTKSSVELGVAMLRDAQQQYGPSIWQIVKDTLYNQITRHPGQVLGGTATGISLIPQAWQNTINTATNVIKSIPSPIAKKTAAFTTFMSLIPGVTGKQPWRRIVNPMKKYTRPSPRVIDESYLQSRIDYRKPSLYQKLVPIGLAGALGAAAMKGFGRREPPPPRFSAWNPPRTTEQQIEYLKSFWQPSN